MSQVVDTPIFQRLKDIRQTSYAPLYPGAYHNRFVHSLGVYHLGRIAFQSIQTQLEHEGEETKLNGQIEKIKQIFELSCLLHDIGHAPFSHTSEDFFEDQARTMDHALIECVQEDSFQTDFNALGTNLPAAHERMSCIVGLRGFPAYFKDAQGRSLFARCILGLPYQFNDEQPKQATTGMTEEELDLLKSYNAKKKRIELLNCVISLLNSSIIDVDRLDYIIRDAETIGFDNVRIDYRRLLSGVRIVKYESKYCIGYHKSALSTIESAIYAHDAEKKWVQNHPVIIYEMEVLKNAVNVLTELFKSEHDPNPLFCYEALTEKGKHLIRYEPLFDQQENAIGDFLSPKGQELLKDNRLFARDSGVAIVNGTLCVEKKYSISLLADEDILYLIKCLCKGYLAYEYFTRDKRRLAAWKSEAEFRTLFQTQIGDGSKAIDRLEKALDELAAYSQKALGMSVINEKVLGFLDKEEERAEREKRMHPESTDIYDDILRGVKEKKYWINIFQKIHKKLNEQEIRLEFEFLIVPQKAFSSSFKESIEKIPIVFPNLHDEPYPLGQIITVLGTSSKRKSNFFHLFYTTSSPIDSVQKKRIVHTISSELISGVLSEKSD